MTQGEQQHPSGMSGVVGPSCPKDAAAAERRSSSPLDERERITMEGRVHHLHQHHHHHHHHHQSPEQTTAAATAAADGDVKTLLQFVSLASSDIKAALDKSAPSTTTKSSLVESNRKHSQKHSKQTLISNLSDVELCRGADTHSPLARDGGFSSRRLIATLNSSPSSPGNANGALHFSERLMASASLHRDNLVKSSELVNEFAFGNNVRRDSDQLLPVRRVSSRYLDRRNASSAGREFTDMSTLNRGCEPEQENPVPLRKRRLPASFWQEPDRSENHKTTPGTQTGLSLVNLNSNLKFPSLLSSVVQGFAESRPTSLDKNAIYPSSDQCFSGGVNLPFPPSLSTSLSSDSYLNRALNFQYSSICSCHQHTELFSYDRGPACVACTARHGGETPGMFNPISATGLLSRWHVPPPLTTDRADMCHPSIPRVVKPIPTKSITSYPPRYHPIYT